MPDARDDVRWADDSTAGWYWECACGYKTPDDGDGKGYFWWLNHHNKPLGGAKAGHKNLGMFDRTGHFVCKTTKSLAKVLKGRVYLTEPLPEDDGDDDDEDEDGVPDGSAGGRADPGAGGDGAGGGGADDTGGKAPRGPSSSPLSDPLRGNMRQVSKPGVWATFKGLQIEFPAWVLTYVAMFMQIVHRPDGTEYEWSKEGVIEFIVDWLRKSFESKVPALVDFTGGNMDEIDRIRRIRTTIDVIEGIGDEEVAAMALRGIQRQHPEFAAMMARELSGEASD